MKNLKNLYSQSEVAQKSHRFLLEHEQCDSTVSLRCSDSAVAVAPQPIDNPYSCDRDFHFERHDKSAYHTQVIPQGRYIGEVINDSFKDWKSGDAIWFGTKCGSGKTHVFRSALSYYKTCGYKILYIGSRDQLMNQNKLLAAKELKNQYADWPAEFLKGIDHFDNFIYFATYQQIAEKYRNGKEFRLDVFTNAKAIVFLDEIHWITSDALFSSAPNVFLEYFFSQFRNAIKVFMSATDWDCYEQIEARLPKSRLKLLTDGTVLADPVVAFNKVYLSESNRLENATTYFYEKLETLISKINASKEKWLILVESKKQGEDLREHLHDSCFIFRECGAFSMSDVAKEEKRKIVKDEEFSAKVLISTAIMDVGTNIKSDEVINVVVDTWDPVTAVQFVGRIRRRSTPIKVILCNRTSDDVIKYLRYCIGKTLRDIDLHYQGLGNIREYEVTVFTDLLKRGLLYWCGDKLVKNEMAILKLKNMQQYYRHILWETAVYGEKSFFAHQLELFGFVLEDCTDIECDVKSQIHDELVAFVDSYIGKELAGTEYSGFCKKFDEFLDQLGTKDHRGNGRYQVEKLKRAFATNGLLYTVTNSNGIYIITAVNAE